MPARRPTSPAARRPASRPSGARGGSARPTTTSNASVGTKPKAPAKGTSKAASNGTSKGAGSAKGAAPASGKGSGKGSGASTGKGTASGRRGSRRPAGPAREDRRRSRYGLVLPEVLTVRLIVLSVVVLLAVVLLLPTVRGAVTQAHELDRLRTELAQNRAERDRLEVELGRWEDRSYVEEQARSRLSFVMPADKVWRVVDPDAAGDDDVDPVTGEAVGSGPVGTSTGPSVPWYQSVWESVRVADGPAATDDAADDATEDDTAGDGPEPGGSGTPSSGAG
ncbi:septum formation initiator family protein [Isoptericola sp. NPDC058082]|uniref:FtsB family cell division protein n=1 Tax=Isoptericola sp. NPDC058082 TaxID=3346331 RepID=UPI0036E4CEB2